MKQDKNIQIRKATQQDLSTIAAIEQICFPIEEAATIESFAQRLEVYADHFWLLEINGVVAGFIDGFVTEEKAIQDEMFEKAYLHNPAGCYQAVFGLNVLPEYRRRGYAAALLEALIADAEQAGRTGCILTCKEQLIPYYEKFGFVNQGVSSSKHGGAVWYNMLLDELLDKK